MGENSNKGKGFSEARQDKPAGKAVEEPDHRLGHRERLRERFRASGQDALADYEMLELLLLRPIARADTKPLGKALLKRFHNIAGVL